MPRYPHLEAFETSVDKKAAGVALKCHPDTALRRIKGTKGLDEHIYKVGKIHISKAALEKYLEARTVKELKLRDLRKTHPIKERKKK